ncbi:hypothetical protein [Chryseobacterium oranimense]|uniref:hypothetical protein n=1 Tax=Chryseobacterium oranimense TaxID=421058 RepID=UPI002236B3E3|nr:hypothetical protein [Chryseobacterium oranimense]
MKSLKEFITENLEKSTILTVQENTEKQVEENQENADKNTNENNENILQGQTKKDSDEE